MLSGLWFQWGLKLLPIDLLAGFTTTVWIIWPVNSGLHPTELLAPLHGLLYCILPESSSLCFSQVWSVSISEGIWCYRVAIKWWLIPNMLTIIIASRAHRPTGGGEGACKPHTACTNGEMLADTKFRHKIWMAWAGQHVQVAKLLTL